MRRKMKIQVKPKSKKMFKIKEAPIKQIIRRRKSNQKFKKEMGNKKMSY